MEPVTLLTVTLLESSSGLHSVSKQSSSPLLNPYPYPSNHPHLNSIFFFNWGKRRPAHASLDLRWVPPPSGLKFYLPRCGWFCFLPRARVCSGPVPRGWTCPAGEMDPFFWRKIWMLSIFRICWFGDWCSKGTSSSVTFTLWRITSVGSHSTFILYDGIHPPNGSCKGGNIYIYIWYQVNSLKFITMHKSYIYIYIYGLK